MAQLVRLHGDYFIEPIFLGAEDFDETDYVNASDLPLSPELMRDIDVWQQDLNDSLNLATGRSRLSEEEWDEMRSRGVALARRLQSELGSEYEVYYENQPVREAAVL